MPLPPGTYLRKRRQAAGLSIEQVAFRLAALPWAVKPANISDIRKLETRITAVEAGQDHFTPEQAALLRNVFRFDTAVYTTLLTLQADRQAEAFGYPVPQVCRECGCSWDDACYTDLGPCAWLAADLCTACEHAADGSEKTPLPFHTAPAREVHQHG